MMKTRRITETTTTFSVFGDHVTDTIAYDFV